MELRFKERHDFLWGLWQEILEWQRNNPDRIKEQAFQSYKMRVAQAYEMHKALVDREYRRHVAKQLESLTVLFYPYEKKH